MGYLGGNHPHITTGWSWAFYPGAWWAEAEITLCCRYLPGLAVFCCLKPEEVPGGFNLCVKSETAFLEQVHNSCSLWTPGEWSLSFAHPRCPEEGGGGPGGQLTQEQISAPGTPHRIT